MSTHYVTACPMTLKTFKKVAKENGWKDDKTDKGQWCMSKDGHYCPAIETCCLNGKTHVMFTKYGENYNVHELAEELGAVSEYDEEYSELFGLDEEE